MSMHRLARPRRALLDRVVDFVRAVATLPYRPGEIDPRPILGPRRPAPAKPPAQAPARRAHAAGSRSDLRPVGDLLAAARAARIAAELAAARTEPIALDEIPLLAHTGVEDLVAETHARNTGPIPVRARAAWQVDLITPSAAAPTARFRLKEIP